MLVGVKKDIIWQLSRSLCSWLSSCSDYVFLFVQEKGMHSPKALQAEHSGHNFGHYFSSFFFLLSLGSEILQWLLLCFVPLWGLLFEIYIIIHNIIRTPFEKNVWGPTLTSTLCYIWEDKNLKVFLVFQNFACGPK